MADLLSYSLRSTFAQEFYQSLTDPNSNDRYYMYYGKPLGWGASVPSAVDTIEEENNAKRNALFYQLIVPSDVSLVAPRYNWTSGVVYDKYEDDVALWEESKKYYVLVQNGDDYNVYLCLNNNNGAPSTVSPSGTTVNEFITSDKYVWKFLYALTNEMQKFLTNDYLPVLVLDQIVYNDERALALNVKANASNGSIQTVTVDTAASFTGLINPNLTDSHIVQTYNSSTLTLTVNLQDLNPTNDHYNTNYVMYFDNGSIGTIDTYTVSVNTVTITLCELVGEPISNGTRYSILPKVNVSGSGTGAVVVPKFTSNVLSSVEVIDGGQNYGFAEVFFLISTTAKMSAIIPPSGGHGYDLNNELRPTKILINKEFNYNTIGVDSKYFAAGSRFSQFGIVKNVKDTQGDFISDPISEYDIILTVQPNTPLNYLFGPFQEDDLNFTSVITESSIETLNPFDNTLTIQYSNWNNTTGKGIAEPNTAPYNQDGPSPYANFYEVGDIIVNSTKDLGTYYQDEYGIFVGKVTNVVVTSETPKTSVTFKVINGAFWNNGRDAVNVTKNLRLDLVGNDTNLQGNDFLLGTVDQNGYQGSNPNNFSFYTFSKYKNSTGQGANNNNFGTFFHLNDIVIQKNETDEVTYRGKVVAIIEPGMGPSKLNENPYNPSLDNRRCTTVVLKNITNTVPKIPLLFEFFEDDELIKRKNCFINETTGNNILLLTFSERGDSGIRDTVCTKQLTSNSISFNDLLSSTHLLGNESLSIGQIKPDSVAIDPNNTSRLKLKLINPSDDFVPATISNNTVIEGEAVTFLKRSNISESPFTTGFISYNTDKLFVLDENYNRVSSESSVDVLSASNIKKIQIKRVDSTNTGQMDAVIPVPLSGSYLYRASTSTEDSASGLIISKGEPVVSGSDTLIDVYYVEEKGSFELGDDIIIVENPFVRQIIEKGLGATDSTVTLVTNSAPQSYTNIFVNKYSGQVLYTQNITPVELTTDTNFNTRILLGF